MVPAILCAVGLPVLVATNLEGDCVTSDDPGTIATGLVLVITGRASDTVTLLTAPDKEELLLGAVIFVMVATKIYNADVFLENLQMMSQTN